MIEGIHLLSLYHIINWFYDHIWLYCKTTTINIFKISFKNTRGSFTKYVRTIYRSLKKKRIDPTKLSTHWGSYIGCLKRGNIITFIWNIKFCSLHVVGFWYRNFRVEFGFYSLAMLMGRCLEGNNVVDPMKGKGKGGTMSTKQRGWSFTLVCLGMFPLKFPFSPYRDDFNFLSYFLFSPSPIWFIIHRSW